MYVSRDSTSSTICNILSTNPNTLAQVRAEHDRPLDPDFSAVPSLLKEQSHLNIHLVYTTAVIKEALSLFPLVACSCTGSPSADFLDDQGDQSSIKNNAVIFTVHTELHRAPA